MTITKSLVQRKQTTLTKRVGATGKHTFVGAEEGQRLCDWLNSAEKDAWKDKARSDIRQALVLFGEVSEAFQQTNKEARLDALEATPGSLDKIQYMQELRIIHFVHKTPPRHRFNPCRIQVGASR